MRTGARGQIAAAIAACSDNLRNRNLRRAQASFGLMWAGEWAATVAAGVVAFDHGGPTAVGLVGVARMVPAALVAPLAATVADRGRRHTVLAWIGAVRALSLGTAALVSVSDGPVVIVYVALVAATLAQTLFRPTHSALLPTLCTTPADLTSANVVRGMLDSIATLGGPLGAAMLLEVSGPAAVFAASAAASGLAAVLATSLRYEQPPRLTDPRIDTAAGRAVEGIRAIASDPAMTLLTALTTLQTFSRGALTVFSVVVAFKLLDTGAPGVGVLTAAVGAGAIAGSFGATLLVGRGGLARWFGIGVALWGAPLAALGLLAHAWSSIALLAIVGVGNALVDVGVFTLLARLADDARLGRVFAAFEGAITLGVAAGAIVAPLLTSAFGLRSALVIIGTMAPATVLACWRALRRLDERVRVRDDDVALLQRVPMLRPLPEATIEQLASRLTRIELSAGACVFEQGDEGDEFYVIERGRAEVVRDEESIAALEPGSCFGEIALIRSCPRTASVRAITALTVRTLNHSAFVTAVTGYPRSAQIAERVITRHLSGLHPTVDASLPMPPASVITQAAPPPGS